MAKLWLEADPIWAKLWLELVPIFPSYGYNRIRLWPSYGANRSPVIQMPNFGQELAPISCQKGDTIQHPYTQKTLRIIQISPKRCG